MVGHAQYQSSGTPPKTEGYSLGTVYYQSNHPPTLRLAMRTAAGRAGNADYDW